MTRNPIIMTRKSERNDYSKQGCQCNDLDNNSETKYCIRRLNKPRNMDNTSTSTKTNEHEK